MTTDATVAGTPAAAALMDQITVAKTLAMLVLGLGSFVLGVVPLKLTKWWRKNPSGVTSLPPPSSSSSSSSASSSRGGHSHGGDTAAATSPVVSLLLCFGGGVLLFTTLLHLQPEVREGVSRLQRAGRLPDGQGTEHLGDLIFCAGFFVVFFVDEIVHSVLDRCAAAGRANHGSAEEVLHRSMSLRRRTMSIPRASLLQSGCSPSSMPSVAGGASTASIKELLDKDERRYRPAARWDTTAAVHRGDDRPRPQPQPPPPLSSSRRHPGDDVEKRQTKTTEPSAGDEHSFRGLFAVLALSFHEVFEGLAIGLEERVDNVWYLFVAVATHKLVIAFCIGLELAWSNTRRPVLVVYVATFAVVTPVGIAIGMALVQCGTAADDGAPGRLAVVLQGLAAGTLLYVVFFEVLARHKQSGFTHLLSILFGFTVLLVLQMITHHHSHGPTDNNNVHHHQHSDHHDHSSHGNHHVHDHSSHENHHIHDH